MEPFRIHILGCGSALPTPRHCASSQVVEIRGKMFMIDCGEGTQVQLRHSHISFTKIRAVFISHLHGDHCFGLIGMISTFGMLGRINDLHVYAPQELESILDAQLKLFCPSLDYKVIFHAVDTAQQAVIYEDRSLTVESLPLDHRVPCCGFLFHEKETARHILRDMIDCYEIPISQINNIKLGADWVTDDGEVIPNERLTSPGTPGRSYAYCSDTRYLPELVERIRQVDLLYHESTYTDDLADRAKLYYHSTARQAATIAKQAQVGKLLLGHYSARYECEDVILQEAKSVFPNSYLSDEGMVVDV
ncbi:ribonuclease Z [Prevotella sp. A2931]|uniref:Ribonuclease Z n=1 Tax=Prevotella illustrans TaxID=2800387 RepID=A0ABS3M3V3_9BACT|nr:MULTISPECIES: ribonuclease Z [Prevotella]MBO1362761.1 ribonuclease Z [Prevotella illustrans]PTL25754.1 ribonuclease Z [Prevotella sp. oral taxon 820]